MTGPIDVITDPKAGALDEDLRTACLRALELEREDVAEYAQCFSWRAATEQFLSHLHPRRFSTRSEEPASLAVDPIGK